MRLSDTLKKDTLEKAKILSVFPGIFLSRNQGFSTVSGHSDRTIPSDPAEIMVPIPYQAECRHDKKDSESAFSAVFRSVLPDVRPSDSRPVLGQSGHTDGHNKKDGDQCLRLCLVSVILRRIRQPDQSEQP